MSDHSSAEESTYVPPQRIGFKTLGQSDGPVYEQIASRALRHFGIRDYSIEHFVRHSNVTAKIARPGMPGLALRIRTGPAVSALTELTWLLAVRASTRVSTVEPYGGTLTENMVMVPHPVDGAPVECSLFFWAEGESLAAHLAPQSFQRLGAMSAELHSFAAGWEAPDGLNPLRWDRTMYYAGTRLVLADSEYSRLLSSRDADVVERVVREADEELARIAALPDPMFLHGNIEMWNLLVDTSGGLRLLDFEDVMLGQPLQDVAITLYYGMERADYPDLAAAFREGYTATRDWPAQDEHDLKLLMAARATMLLNHAFLTESDPLPVVRRLLPIILEVG